MTIREQTEQLEIINLSRYAAKSVDAIRNKPVKKCDIRTEFQRDRDKITHCKAFRRLMHKTQVFISPEGDHYRTRLTHTLEVSQIARTISRALRLNDDLTEAIALGHDLGHTPYGHAGEDALDHVCLNGFRHNEQSIRVVEIIENGGEGLNLTTAVLDGILNHRGSGKPNTLEGKVVQLSDKIAYINHDIDDAVRAGLLSMEELPLEGELKGSRAKRIDFLVRHIIEESSGKPDISMRDDVSSAVARIREYLFNNFYYSLQFDEKETIRKKIGGLFNYFRENIELLPEEFKLMIQKGENKERVLSDYIACMTDRYATKLYEQIFLNK